MAVEQPKVFIDISDPKRNLDRSDQIRVELLMEGFTDILKGCASIKVIMYRGRLSCTPRELAALGTCRTNCKLIL